MASLRTWMDKSETDILEAAELFGVSVYAVKKWLSGDRIPRPATQTKIKKLTKGMVSGDDWMKE